ncbi:MAG: DUF2157 domain-containing protein [Elusimicrobiota bacterium]
MDEFVGELAAKGLLDEPAARRLDELETRAHVPLARELHALLYLGALLVLAGIGAAVKDHLNQLGPMTILVALAAGASACLVYCFRAGPPYGPARVESPNVAFDYILYLAVGLAGIFAAYLEWKWHLLGDWWDLYLFFAGLTCLGLAYRFDNRLVLSTGLVNLAGWAGVRFARWEVPALGVRAAAFALGSVLIGLAEASRRSGVKAHFEDTYLRGGTHLCLLSLIYGVDGIERLDLWLLLAACGALAAGSARRRTFEVFARSIVYAYVGTLSALHPLLGGGGDAELRMVVLTSGFVLFVLLWARRRFQEDA